MSYLFTAVATAATSPTLSSPILDAALSLMKSACTLGGGFLAIWGIIQIATNLKDHNGPAITGGVWQLLGGVMIVVAGQLFLSI